MFLVTGATGRVGRLVAHNLVADGHRVLGLTRDPAAELPGGVERIVGDLRDASTLPRDASAVVLIWALGSADGAAEAVEALTAGGARVVYVSSAAVEDGAARQAHPYSAFHAEIERLLAATAPEWTALRATTFAANALGWADAVQAKTTIELPLASTRR